MAALSTGLLLLLMVLQPLASRFVSYSSIHTRINASYSLFQVKDTQIQKDPISVPKFGTVGLNESLSVRSRIKIREDRRLHLHRHYKALRQLLGYVCIIPPVIQLNTH